MKHLRLVLAFLVVAALLCSISSQAQAQEKKKKKGKGVTGEVVSVKDNVIVIRVTTKKKDALEEKAKEMKFKIGADTKIERAGKKGQPAVAANVDQIMTGQQVRIIYGATPDDPVASIQLLGKKKKKKAAS